MGYIRHQAVIAIVSDWDSDKKAIEAIEALRVRMTANTSGVPDCILGPCKGVNGYLTYVYAPDGSKERWATSDDSNDFRAEFMAAVKLASYPNIVELQMGGDDGETKILFTTDETAESLTG